jgi:tRNA(Ile)-lysidine synthase
MPRSKKENKIEEEAKIQNVEIALGTKKMVDKKPLSEKKAKTESKTKLIFIEENSDLGITDIPIKSKSKPDKKSVINSKAEFSKIVDNSTNAPDIKNDILTKKPKNIHKKELENLSLKELIKADNNFVATDKPDIIEEVIENIDLKSEIVDGKSELIDEVIIEKPNNKSNKKFNKKQNFEQKNIIQPVIIKSDIIEDVISPNIDEDVEFIKTESKYYNFESKFQRNQKKLSAKTLKEQLKKDTESKLEESKSLDSENITNLPEIVPEIKPEIDSSEISNSTTSDNSQPIISEITESAKPEKHIAKSHEEKLREKNERIEQARILNRMNQLRQNEERRLLKIQSLVKDIPETGINTEFEVVEIPIVKPEEKHVKKPEHKKIEKVEKIKPEKPAPKTEEEKIRERNERIEQARIQNRINQINRNKEKLLLKQQQSQSQSEEQKELPLEMLPASQPMIDEAENFDVNDIVIEPAAENAKIPAKEHIKHAVKDTVKHHHVKESAVEQLKEIVTQPEITDINDELDVKAKDVKLKPEHPKKAPKAHAEKHVEEIKTKKPIPDLILDYSILNPKKLLTNTQKNDPFLKSFYDKVEDFLKKELFIEKGFKILVAVSGGVDSIVLLDCLALLSNKLFFNVYVAHFNHKMRGESSEKDEKFVSGLAQDYNLQFYLASGNVKSFAEKNSISIEHAARQLRYNFFERTARNLNIDYVATAHTADDSAETFLINLIRGSGLTGLSGIPAKRQFVKNISIVRPLLGFHKNELFEYTKKRKLFWRQDESNALLNYTRNKIRLDLLPKLENEYNPSIIDTINRTSRLIYGADEIIKDIVKKNIPNLIIEASGDKFSMKISMLQTFSEFLQGEFIQHSWLKYFRLQPLSLAVIDRILNLFNSQTGAVCEINSQFFALKDRNTIIFSKKNIEEKFKQLVTVPCEINIGKQKIVFKEIEKKDLKYSSDPNIEYFDSKAFEGFVELRTWAEGDSFQPLGMNGDIKISDYLINEKISLIDKSKILVLTNKMEILWVVGKRISEKFKVKKSSKVIIKAEIIKTEKK